MPRPPTPATQPEGLPPGLEGWRWLSARGAAGQIARATFQGQPVAVRISASSADAERRSELAVLAAVRHPGLATCLDQGTLPDGRAYLIRSWIEGPDLASWARGRAAEELGALAARLCAALEHLHSRGFVHGDLKASNVIVRAAPHGTEPVLTDFGLSRLAGEVDTSGAASGSLFHIAPEVLLGGALTPAADLFALGAMLHELLVGRRPSAREFYGRFPRDDFFQATDTAPQDLPEWSRDVVASLLARDPARRPASAARLGRTLAARIGVELDGGETPERLRWSVLQGREAWRARWWSEVGGASDAATVAWIEAPPGEAVEDVAESLAIAAAIGGHPVARVHLARELEGIATTAGLDAWAEQRARERKGRVLFVAVDEDDAWQVRAAAALARVLSGRAPAESGLTLVAVSSRAAPDAELDWNVAALPRIEAREVEAFLAQNLAGAAERSRLAELAALISDAGRGTAGGVDRAFDALARQGWLLAGDGAPRLRPGPLPRYLGAEAAHLAALGSDERSIWHALHLAGGAASRAELAGLGALGQDRLEHALEQLLATGSVAVRLDSLGTPTVEALQAPTEAWAAELSASEWRALNDRRASQLERAAGSSWRSLPHRFAAGSLSDAELLDGARSLREEGVSELALALLEDAERLARARGAQVEPSITAERAFAWCDLGQAGRALEIVEPLRARDSKRVQALVARVDGRVAALGQAQARALERFEAARQLDPEDAGEALLAKAQLLFDARRHAELEALLATLPTAESAISPRVRNNLRAIGAMLRFRTGDVRGARDLLQSELAAADRSQHPSRAASLELNLATVERRAGNVEPALAHVERAIDLYERGGNLAGIAQARALRGGVLRETGRLREAEPELAEALAIRSRLGAASGAATVRGMLGLLHADRGQARSAVEELERAAAELRTAGHTHDALLLEARAREARARLGQEAAPESSAGEANRAGEGDPRALIARARAAWLTGAARAARESAERAAALARSLGLAAVVEEAELLLQLLEGVSIAAQAERSASSSAQDRWLCSLLASAPLDGAALRALALELALLGREDRAARAWIALCARATDDALAQEAAEQARGLLEACCAGASAAERAALERALLGLPDPWPEDLITWRQRSRGADRLEDEVIELLDINHRLLAQEDLRSLLGAIVEQALSVSGAQRGFLVLEEEGELSVDTALDSRRGGIAESDVEFSGSALRRALETMRPVRVSNAVDDPLLGGAPSVIALELRSILCVPFKVDEVQRGVIYVDHRLREAAFDERAERMLQLLADQAALAILQVRRLEEIRRLNRELKKHVVAVESDLKTARHELSEAGLPATAGGLVGSSEPMRAVRRLLERAAPSKLAVLVSGESGTGKELAARALHELSPRAQGPFVSENCAALPPSLIEAELFGARKGAYTGAIRDREGLFERAHGGTLFLDEIGELPLDLQAKLLRVLETSELRRIGDERPRRVDFRLVAATNRDLESEVAAGRFRADLFYRLRGLEVRMPSLAVRSEDIPALVDHFLRLAERDEGVRRSVTKPVLAKLVRRPWPGNVRELANEIARLCVLSEGDLRDPELVSAPATAPVLAAAGEGSIPTLAQLERVAIERALQATGGDKNEAARLLGISRAKIYQRLKEWRGEDDPLASGTASTFEAP